MKSKLLHEDSARTYALIFETGDEVIGTLREFARAQRLGGSHFTAIGALREVTLAYFDWETKAYEEIPVREQVEVLTLAGNIALHEGEPKVHAHVVIGKRDGMAYGGHLIEGYVRPTLELILTESPQHLQRRHDPETGLALIAL